jgi:hypothetical protein
MYMLYLMIPNPCPSLYVYIVVCPKKKNRYQKKKYRSMLPHFSLNSLRIDLT